MIQILELDRLDERNSEIISFLFLLVFPLAHLPFAKVRLLLRGRQKARPSLSLDMGHGMVCGMKIDNVDA